MSQSSEVLEFTVPGAARDGGDVPENLRVFAGAIIDSAGPTLATVLNRAVALLEEAGSQDWTLALAERQLALALEELDDPDLRLRPAAAGELAELARFVVGRDF